MDDQFETAPLLEKAGWETPQLRRIPINEAEAGILFGPEILILLS